MDKIIRDANNNIKFRMTENSQSSRIIIRNGEGTRIGSYDKNSGQMRDSHNNIVYRNK